jgi:transcriptional regulator with XRE-family HTH domain
MALATDDLAVCYDRMEADVAAYLGAFGERLDRAIHDRGESQSGLERATGIDQSAISAMTRGKRRPYVDQASAIAHALGVSLDFLAGNESRSPTGTDLTTQERFLIERIRNQKLDPGWVLDLVLRELQSGSTYAAAGGIPMPMDKPSIGKAGRKNKRPKAPDVPRRKG